MLHSSRFERYVAIGDSSTEGLDDPDGHGGYRGWSQRLAERLATEQGSLLYANLGVRGRTTRQIRDGQLDRAIAMRPDLVTLFSGTNDVVRPGFDAAGMAEDIVHMQRALAAAGATVATFTLPDLTPLMPIARLIAPRIRALNNGVRRACAETGTRLVDFAAFPVATDARLWSDDRIHANAAGHARIAEALAEALGLPGSDAAWQQPLPVESRRSWGRTIAGEIAWMRGHALPWIWRGLGGPPGGKELRCKRPELAPIGLSESRE